MISKDDVDKLRQLAVERIEEGPDREALLKADLADSSDLPAELLQHDRDDVPDEKVVKIRDMNIPQKVKLAMFGNKAARAVLLRDPNRMIQIFVLDNPRITDSELADIAKNNQVDEQVLRNLTSNSQWMRPYSMKVSICNNPKVPADIALKWIKFLTDRDLQALARSRNVPQIVATQARKLSEKRQKKAGGGGGH